jgi:hypothetical protein
LGCIAQATELTRPATISDDEQTKRLRTSDRVIAVRSLLTTVAVQERRR